MFKKSTALTLLMLNLLAIPAFCYSNENTAELNFAPIESTVYTPAKVKKNGSADEVLFYIPVYTMTVNRKKEAVPAAAGGGGVIMPVFNQSNYKKSSVSPSTPQVSPPANILPETPSQKPDTPDITPSDPEISTKPQDPESAGSLSDAEPASNYEKSKNITAAAPLGAILPAAIFKKGARLKVKSLDEVASKDKIYKKVDFVTLEPVVTTYSTIPIGTLVSAEILEIKEPKRFGKGAEVSLKAEKLFFDDQIRSIEGIVTQVEEKKVRFNRIKGERTYWKEVLAYGEAGKENYRKSLAKSKNYLKNPKTFLISPFPVIGGAFGAIGHYAAAPFSSIGKKGEEVELAQGSYYEIKLTSDLKVEKPAETQTCAAAL